MGDSDWSIVWYIANKLDIRAEIHAVVSTMSLMYDNIPGQHHDGPAVGLPAHPPEVVPGGVQRALGHDKLPLGVEARREVSVDVVTAVLIVAGLELYPAVVVWQDVGEPVTSQQLQCIMRQICF